MRMLTERQLLTLGRHSGKDKAVMFTERGGHERVRLGTVEDEVFILVGQHKHVLQRIRLDKSQRWDRSQYVYRTGYYTFSDDRSRLVWGQYSQLLTELEWPRLLRKARRKGWPV